MDGELESYGAWIKWVFGTYLFRLIGINAVFLICCVPVVTIPAAMCGMHAVIQRYYRKKYGTSVVSAFFEEFLACFVKRTLLVWAVLILPGLIAVLTWKVFPTAIWFSLSGIMFVAAMLTLSWLIPQLVLLNLSPWQAFKNALIFTGMESKKNFLLIAIHAICLTVVIYGLPVSAFLLIFLPVVHAVITTGITMPVLRRYLVQSDS